VQGQLRLVDYMCGIFPQFASRKGVKKAFKNGRIYLNGSPVEGIRYARVGDMISLIRLLPERVYQRNLQIVFEDDYLAVIIKPAGLSVSGNTFQTIARALPYNLLPGVAIDALDNPIPVHRLDAQTSGLLVLAKSSVAATILGRLFESRQIYKTYMALVAGTPPDRGEFHADVEGRNASTTYEKVSSVRSLQNGTLSLLRLTPRAERTHQLRIHLALAGHPILGDSLYGKKGNVLTGKGLFLCAVGLMFAHPVFPEREIKLEIPLPRKFTSRMEKEERRWRKYRE